MLPSLEPTMIKLMGLGTGAPEVHFSLLVLMVQGRIQNEMSPYTLSLVFLMKVRRMIIRRKDRFI